MPLTTVDGLFIKQIINILPKKKEDNLKDLLLNEGDKQRLINQIGIRYRYTQQRGDQVKTAFESAVKKACENLEWELNEIDILIVVTQTNMALIPAMACRLQGDLKMSSSCMALDLNLGCSGFVYGLQTMASLLNSIQKKKPKGILCCGDFSTLLTEDSDQSTRPIFSDGVSAAAIELEQASSATSYFNLETFGEGQDAICTEKINAKRWMRMNGLDVFGYSVNFVPQNIKTLIEFSSQDKEAIDYYIFHQANKIINDAIKDSLDVPTDKVPSSLYQYGNTSSASIPITLGTIEDHNELNTYLFSGFGVGFSVGSALLPGHPAINCKTLFQDL